MPECKHYWVIQPAQGTTSQGTCQTCGESREFFNYFEQFDFMGAGEVVERHGRNYYKQKAMRL